MRITALFAALGLMVTLAGQSHADEIDWAKVDAALGKTVQSRAMSTATAYRAVTFRSPSMAWPLSLRWRSEAGLVSSRALSICQHSHSASSACQ